MEEIEKLTGDAIFPVAVIGEEVIVGHRPDEFAEALKNDK